MTLLLSYSPPQFSRQYTESRWPTVSPGQPWQNDKLQSNTTGTNIPTTSAPHLNPTDQTASMPTQTPTSTSKQPLSLRQYAHLAGNGCHYPLRTTRHHVTMFPPLRQTPRTCSVYCTIFRSNYSLWTFS